MASRTLNPAVVVMSREGKKGMTTKTLSMEKVLSPLFRGGNRGSEMFRNLPKVTE